MPSNRSVPPSELKEPFRCHTITQGKANIMEPENREVTWRIALDRAGTLGRAGPARPDPLVPRVISGLDFFRHDRHIVPCRAGTISLLSNPSTAHSTPARLRAVPAQARPSGYLQLDLYASIHDFF